MTPRRVTAAICLVAIVLLVMGAFSKRWLVADVRRPDVNASVRIGLTSIRYCLASEMISTCEKVSWSTLQSRFGGHIEGGSWMWLGRLTFALSLVAAALALAVGVIAGAGLDLRLPVPLPRLARWAGLVLLPFMGGYYALTPNAFSEIGAGRGFAFCGLGAILAAVAGYRETAEPGL